ncbi:LysR family transcriptional regulator [Gordonia polyisoprenivorans]|uniref:LysR family transcriptional regulator n=1 Tax=Gordonia TaxID=2053 RepID=UPI0009ADA1FD|nr:MULTISPECIES: LysR family transcriptional regulator [Gordonia]MBE7191107.1 LysR family transcriptional regulator [Gordonia polyisoprenivorans]MDF3283567.1 LysR family transcriptional regulator [Gordonia sp. N1V]OPX16837.1 LysR family transcriptional regulator [Gordonia sp. i37]QUD85471.1 LysR family transcriptional regulator [Gordonia polyisoprenivorans]
MPDLPSLETLLAVVTTGSLNAAAGELGITQQAVSARMRALEATLGISLLTRSPTGTAPTEAGILVSEWADRLLGLASEFDAGLAALRRERRDELRLAASLTVAEHLLPQWLVSFGQSVEHAPKVSFTATNSEHACELVRAGDVELGFVEGPQVAPGVRSRVVAHDTLVLVVPPGHPWTRRRTAVSADELARTPLVTRESGSGTRLFLDTMLAAAHDPDMSRAQPVLELSTTAAVRSAVIAGAGPAVVSDLSVRDDLGRRLIAVPVSGLDLRRALRAVWIGGDEPRAGAARDFLTHVTRSAGRP